MPSILGRAFAAAVLALLCAPTFAASAPLAPDKVRIDQLLGETQKTSPSTDTLDIVWWIPPQFWQSVLTDDATDPAVREEITELFGGYTVFAVAYGKLGTFGASGFLDEDALRNELELVDMHGGSHAPLSQEDVDERFGVMVQMMKPVLANLIGQLGSNIHFIAFPAKDADGRRVVDPYAEGRMVVQLKDHAYAFRLPLGSLLSPKRDAGAGEIFPGSYDYNPYTGAKLEAAPSP
jgi:hypothetical protein